MSLDSHAHLRKLTECILEGDLESALLLHNEFYNIESSHVVSKAELHQNNRELLAAELEEISQQFWLLSVEVLRERFSKIDLSELPDLNARKNYLQQLNEEKEAYLEIKKLKYHFINDIQIWLPNSSSQLLDEKSKMYERYVRDKSIPNILKSIKVIREKTPFIYQSHREWFRSFEDLNENVDLFGGDDESSPLSYFWMVLGIIIVIRILIEVFSS